MSKSDPDYPDYPNSWPRYQTMPVRIGWDNICSWCGDKFQSQRPSRSCGEKKCNLVKERIKKRRLRAKKKEDEEGEGKG